MRSACTSKGGQNWRALARPSFAQDPKENEPFAKAETVVEFIIYSGVRLRRDTYLRGKTFPLFQPSFQRLSGTNDTSFESPSIGRLESAKKFVIASS